MLIGKYRLFVMGLLAHVYTQGSSKSSCNGLKSMFNKPVFPERKYYNVVNN